MRNKSELLANEIETKKIELLQDRINNNSKLINDLTNKLVADYCKQLDSYVKYIQEVINDTKHPPTAEELDDMVIQLPVLLYFCGEAQENLGIKNDVAKSIRQEKYNEIFATVKGTIADKTSASELQVQTETITHIIYSRAYTIVKNKLNAAYELLSSIKKVITRRISETSLANIDEGRFRSKNDRNL